MVKRHFWIDRLEGAWKRRSVVWLSGVRRAGKTFLSQSLRDIEYFDCELPRVRRMIDDPEGFLQGIRGRRIVLDEIHRLERPSEILKIAADHFPSSSYRPTMICWWRRSPKHARFSTIRLLLGSCAQNISWPSPRARQGSRTRAAVT